MSFVCVSFLPIGVPLLNVRKMAGRMFRSYIVLFGFLSILSANYPLRPPEPGEARVSWWWDVFFHDVIVVKGIITVPDIEVPAVRVLISDSALESDVQEKSAEAHRQMGRQFNLGDILIEEVIYVPPRLIHTDSIAKGLSEGKVRELRVLAGSVNSPVSIMTHDGFKNGPDRYRSWRVRKESHYIIVRRANDLFPLSEFCYVDGVPEESKDELLRLVDYRKRGDVELEKLYEKVEIRTRRSK